MTIMGKWLIREGETLDQAKARVDDKEQERLKQQAEEEIDAMFEQEKREEEINIMIECSMKSRRATGSFH